MTSTSSRFVSPQSDIEKAIQPVAFTLGANSGLLSATVHTLHMPEGWQGPLLRLQSEKNSRFGVPNNIAMRSLNSVIQALFPQVFTALPNVSTTAELPRRGVSGGGGTRPWLLASAQIDRNALWRVVRAWINVTYAGCPSFRSVYGDLNGDDLRWQTVNREMLKDPGANGTANLDPDAYKILPTMIAYSLAGVPTNMRSLDSDNVDSLSGAGEFENEQGLEIKVHRESRYLMRVPCAEGAELVSWPPAYLVTNKGRIPYSYVVRITVQTVIGDSVPRIHMHYGVRRWVHSFVNSDGELMMRARNYSVFMRPVHSWGGQSVASAFTVARMRPVPDATGIRIPTWNDSVPEIIEISRAGFSEEVSLPRAEDLAAHPLQWLGASGKDGVQAAITYTSVPLFHAVKQGLSLDVHEQLTSAIAAKMSEKLILCPPLPRLQQVRSAPRKVNPLTFSLREIDQKVGEKGFRLRALAESVASQVTIEIYWQNSRVRDYLAAQVERLLTWDERSLVRDAAAHDQTTEDEDQSDTSGGPSVALPKIAELGVLLPDLEPGDVEDNEEGTSANGIVTEDPELAYIATELGVGGGETRLLDESGKPADSPVHERTRKQKTQRAADERPGTAPEQQTIALPGDGSLHIVTIPIAQIGAADPLDNSERTRRDIRLATEKRAREITSYLQAHSTSKSGTPTVALVELPDYTKRNLRELRHRDPKLAIRLGMLGAGRVTQFIAPVRADLDEEKALDDLVQRSEMAVRDGLRQLGYMPSGIGFTPSDARYAVPSNLIVAAVWMLRLTHKRAPQPIYMPAVVIMRASDSKVWAWLPDGASPSVRPYRQALLDMGKIEPKSVSRNMAQQNLEALKRFITDELVHLGDDVLILVSAQNARTLWPGIGNNFARLDHLQFAKSELPQKVTDLGSRLRVVRLRTSERGETPEYYWPGVRPGNSRAGIWEADSSRRLYFNIGAKPKSMARATRSKEDDPRQYYSIPSVLEIVPIALQPGDEPYAWVNAVYQWRKMSYLTSDNTLYPWPMMLAIRMDEYAQAIGPRVFSAEWDRVEIVDDDESDGDE